MIDRNYLVALYSFLPFGPQRIKLLKKYFGSYKSAWKADYKKLIEIGLAKKTVEGFVTHKQEFAFNNYFSQLKRQKIDFVTIDDSNYPENLFELDDAPAVLYIKGKIKANDTNAVAIVGSRKMTSYGREVTERFATELASMGVTIVSGLAFGIDVCAHKSSLAVGGRCIAVLASGVDMITPRSNQWLGDEIVKKGGAIVSEFPIGTIPQKAFFPHRNRIISGLSKAVIVIEGMIKSGTLHTASHAANQGRTVFAVPGQITSPMSGAPHYLIQNGAKMATSVSDILNELNLQLKVDKDAVEKVMPSDKTEKQILEVLETEEMHMDEIARTSGISVNQVSAKLTMMELKGLVRNMGGGIYKVV